MGRLNRARNIRGRRAHLLCTGLLVLLMLHGATAQPPDPGVIGNEVRPIADEVLTTVLPPTEEAAGQDLHTEDISVSIVLDVNNVEFQTLGIVFGGGKVQADVVAEATLEFRAVSTARLDEAWQRAMDDESAGINRSFGIPVWRTSLTAEEIRLAGTGLLLEAFQSLEEELARQYLQDMVPGLRILGMSAHWSNTVPLAYADPRNFDPSSPPSIPDLREPPLRLDVRLDMQYLDRFSLYEILTGPGEAVVGVEAEANATIAKAVRERIDENQTLAFTDRSAFQVLGFGQLLDLDVPSGLRLDVTFHVPKGFTIEGLTDELEAKDGQQAAVFTLDGRQRSNETELAGVVTVSSRSLVTMTTLGVVLLVGIVIRILVELSVITYYRIEDNRFERRQAALKADNLVGKRK